MDLDRARPILPEARQLAGLAGDEWVESYNLKEQRAEICLRDAATGEIFPIAQILSACPYDDRLLMLRAPLIVQALLVLLDAAFDKIRRLERADRKKNFSAECAMKCSGDRLFGRYLVEKHDLAEAAAGETEKIKTRVRSILGISSMKQLNDNPAAAARWLNLRKDFDAWKR